MEQATTNAEILEFWEQLGPCEDFPDATPDEIESWFKQIQTKIYNAQRAREYCLDSVIYS